MYKPEQLPSAVGEPAATAPGAGEEPAVAGHRGPPDDPMSALLQTLDPSFQVPRCNSELKRAKTRLKQRVASEVERLFVQRLLQENGQNVSAAARQARINRTFLYRLMQRRRTAEQQLQNE